MHSIPIYNIVKMIHCFLATLVIGCGASQFGRMGPIVPLPAGSPRNVCEEATWYELAPARVLASGMEVGIIYNTFYSEIVEGVGVFYYKESDPEDVNELLTDMGEFELDRLHQARIEPVDTNRWRALFWSLGGLAGMSAGIGTAVAIGEKYPTTATPFALSGIAIGLACVAVALISQPSAEEDAYANARRMLFIQGEDDMLAVQRGIERINAKRRLECSNTNMDP